MEEANNKKTAGLVDMSIKSASEIEGLCDRRATTTNDVAHREGMRVLTRNFKKRGKRGASRSILNKASFNQPAMNMRRDILNKDPATRDYKCFFYVRIQKIGKKPSVVTSLWSGNVERYKARMVAGGNEQSFGKNYILTFAAS